MIPALKFGSKGSKRNYRPNSSLSNNSHSDDAVRARPRPKGHRSNKSAQKSPNSQKFWQFMRPSRKPSKGRRLISDIDSSTKQEFTSMQEVARMPTKGSHSRTNSISLAKNLGPQRRSSSNKLGIQHTSPTTESNRVKDSPEQRRLSDGRHNAKGGQITNRDATKVSETSREVHPPHKDAVPALRDEALPNDVEPITPNAVNRRQPSPLPSDSSSGDAAVASNNTLMSFDSELFMTNYAESFEEHLLQHSNAMEGVRATNAVPVMTASTTTFEDAQQDNSQRQAQDLYGIRALLGLSRKATTPGPEEHRGVHPYESGTVAERSSPRSTLNAMPVSATTTTTAAVKYHMIPRPPSVSGRSERGALGSRTRSLSASPGFEGDAGLSSLLAQRHPTANEGPRRNSSPIPPSAGVTTQPFARSNFDKAGFVDEDDEDEEEERMRKFRGEIVASDYNYSTASLFNGRPPYGNRQATETGRMLNFPFISMYLSLSQREEWRSPGSSYESAEERGEELAGEANGEPEPEEQEPEEERQEEQEHSPEEPEEQEELEPEEEFEEQEAAGVQPQGATGSRRGSRAVEAVMTHRHQPSQYPAEERLVGSFHPSIFFPYDRELDAMRHLEGTQSRPKYFEPSSSVAKNRTEGYQLEEEDSLEKGFSVSTSMSTESSGVQLDDCYRFETLHILHQNYDESFIDSHGAFNGDAQNAWYAGVEADIEWVESPELTPDDRPLNDPMAEYDRTGGFSAIDVVSTLYTTE